MGCKTNIAKGHIPKEYFEEETDGDDLVVGIEATRLKSKVFSLVSFWSPPPSLRQRVKYDGWDRETGVGGPFLNLGVA